MSAGVGPGDGEDPTTRLRRLALAYAERVLEEARQEVDLAARRLADHRLLPWQVRAAQAFGFALPTQVELLGRAYRDAVDVHDTAFGEVLRCREDLRASEARTPYAGRGGAS